MLSDKVSYWQAWDRLPDLPRLLPGAIPKPAYKAVTYALKSQADQVQFSRWV
jgi:hypothetical protein